MGGEEFILLLPDTDLSSGEKISEKIRARISEHLFEIDGQSFHISMTFGVAIFDHCREIRNCLKCADEALYRGKKNGRNQVVIATK